MNNILKDLKIGLISTIMIALIVCGIYPVFVWGIAQVLFPREANGSLIIHDGRIMGSSLLAQGFTSAKYFHPRPSAAGTGYDAESSGGSNLGPLSRKLMDMVRQRVADYRAENNLPPEVLIPADAVTASASGLDPHISIKNALLQTPRVAKARGLSEEYVHRKIMEHKEGRDLGIFGEPRVNVLMLNLDLDKSK
jgi:potassium-transporting ATPase KdpC subunit